VNKYEKQSIKKYDRTASNYDNTVDGRYTAKVKKLLIKHILVNDGDKVLDVGCGSGDLIDSINQLADMNAYGIDISPQMITECKRKYQDIKFSVSNGETIDFDDNYFDVVVICCVLHHLNNPQNFFKEAHRILKPNGKLIVAEPNYPPVIKQIADYVVLPLLRAGDNKLFTHRKLTKLFVNNNFALTQTIKKNMKQIIIGEAIPPAP